MNLISLTSLSTRCIDDKINERLFEYQIKSLTLSRYNLEISEKNYINCIKIDNTTNDLLLSGDNMGRIRLFDLKCLDRMSRDRKEKYISNSADNPRCHYKMITSLSWFPLDNGLFISGSTDHFVNIWDTEQFEIVSHIRYKQPVTDVQMPTSGSYTHKLVAVCNGLNGVALVDLYSGNTTQEIVGGPDKGTCCCWNPQNEYEIIVGDRSGCCTLHDVRKVAGHTILGYFGQSISSPDSVSSIYIHFCT